MEDTMKIGVCGYLAFYRGKKIEVWADSSYEAQKKAAAFFKAKRPHEVDVKFCTHHKDKEQTTP